MTAIQVGYSGCALRLRSEILKAGDGLRLNNKDQVVTAVKQEIDDFINGLGPDNPAQAPANGKNFVQIHALQNIKKAIIELADITNKENGKGLLKSATYNLMKCDGSNTTLGINYELFFTMAFNDLNILVAQPEQGGLGASTVSGSTPQSQVIGYIDDKINALLNSYKTDRQAAPAGIEASKQICDYLLKEHGSIEESFAFLRAIKFLNNGYSVNFLSKSDFLLWDNSKDLHFGRKVNTAQKAMTRKIFNQIVKGEHRFSRELCDIVFNGSAIAVGPTGAVSAQSQDAVVNIITACETRIANLYNGRSMFNYNNSIANEPQVIPQIIQIPNSSQGDTVDAPPDSLMHAMQLGGAIYQSPCDGLIRTPQDAFPNGELDPEQIRLLYTNDLNEKTIVDSPLPEVNVAGAGDFNNIINNYVINPSEECKLLILGAIWSLNNKGNSERENLICRLDIESMESLYNIKDDDRVAHADKFWNTLQSSRVYVQYLLEKYNHQSPSTLIAEIATQLLNLYIHENSDNNIKELFVRLTHSQTMKLAGLLELTGLLELIISGAPLSHSQIFTSIVGNEKYEQISNMLQVQTPAIFKMLLEDYNNRKSEADGEFEVLKQQVTMEVGKEYLSKNPSEEIRYSLNYFTYAQISGLIMLFSRTSLAQEINPHIAKNIFIAIENKMKESEFVKRSITLAEMILFSEKDEYKNYICPLVTGMFYKNTLTKFTRDFLAKKFTSFNNIAKIIIQGRCKGQKLPQKLQFIQQYKINLVGADIFETNLWRVFNAAPNSKLLSEAINYFIAKDDISDGFKMAAFEKSGIYEDDFENQLLRSLTHWCGSSATVKNFISYLKTYYLNSPLVPGQKIVYEGSLDLNQETISENEWRRNFDTRVLSGKIMDEFGNILSESVRVIGKEYVALIFQQRSINPQRFIRRALQNVLQHTFEVTNTSVLNSCGDYIELLIQGQQVADIPNVGIGVNKILNNIHKEINSIIIFVAKVNNYVQSIERELTGRGDTKLNDNQRALLFRAYDFVWSPDQLISSLNAHMVAERGVLVTYSFSTSCLRTLLRNIAVDSALEHRDNQELRQSLTEGEIDAVKNFIKQHQFNF